MKASFDSHVIEDNISLVNIEGLGTTIERPFSTLTMGSPDLSFTDDFSSGNYKIAGVSIFRNLDRTEISRETYDLLTFIGDIGGLLDGLYLCGFLIINLTIVRKWNRTGYMMQFLYKSERNLNGKYDPIDYTHHGVTADGLRKGEKYSESSLKILA